MSTGYWLCIIGGLVLLLIVACADVVRAELELEQVLDEATTPDAEKSWDDLEDEYIDSLTTVIAWGRHQSRCMNEQCRSTLIQVVASEILDDFPNLVDVYLECPICDSNQTLRTDTLTAVGIGTMRFFDDANILAEAAALNLSPPEQRLGLADLGFIDEGDQ